MTTSSTTGVTSVDLRTPGQLLAALPHLVGFLPVDSLVAVVHNGASANRVGCVLRADLPPPGAELELAHRLRTPLLAGEPAGVTVVVVGGTGARQEAGPPYAEFVDLVTSMLGELGIPLVHALWVPKIHTGQRWRCYDEPDCGGRLPDPASSVLAAVSAHAGLVTYASREAMEEQLAPDDDVVLARRAALLDAAVDAFATTPGSRGTSAGKAFAVVRTALVRAARGELGFSDQEIAELALALTVTEVRDACLALALPPGGARATTAERLWLVLVRATPEPERAEAASLLAYSAYVRGDGPLAGMAITKALDAHPGHVLAGLLSQALGHSMPPDRLAKLGGTCDAAPLWGPDDDGAPPPTRGSPACGPG
ncbi:DUF4192 domain-containing protein [Prauserella cavernicola]|uniref:DUF4192 domain-containing protein n=1 Tax=Prauserella cavernicola TaxID=2800127 RepID=A0A934QZZ4_9PSEU|nr:DUF4192 domain-containing protein [Prauserella cavernicola]MBK1788348.1 DUF4192 domain-containing protein [Prauserella cavernicola]